METKGPLSKYTNYDSFTASLDYVYAVTDENLYRSPEPIKGDRVHRDIKRNCTFHKDIGHTTDKCMVLKDEIERLIKAGYFKEFIDEPQAANREERPRQRSLEKVREVLIITGGLHLAKESHHARDNYVKDARSPPPVQEHRTETRPTKQVRRELEDIIFREADAR